MSDVIHYGHLLHSYEETEKSIYGEVGSFPVQGTSPKPLTISQLYEASVHRSSTSLTKGIHISQQLLKILQFPENPPSCHKFH